jgi:hypothetical protein
MKTKKVPMFHRPDSVRRFLGVIPYRLQLAGGWIDQPFVSRHNPKPPGSMVVAQVEPDFRPMDRSGFATGTRAVALRLWNGRMPANRSKGELVRELYGKENAGKIQPSGSQDMIGLVYPGISRLDYDSRFEGGVFPVHVESINSARIVRWLEEVLHLLPFEPRPRGYDPLAEQCLTPGWVARLSRAGKDCFDAIRRMDVGALGESFNLNMRCWAALLPNTVRHPSLAADLEALLKAYQRRYAGAMYSGCGGGYLMVASEKSVPGALKIRIRVAGRNRT